MLDVHAPHESAHNVRDILIHLAVITVGLFIALSLEGVVEWHHHRELVQEAQASLHEEISENAKGMKDAMDDLHKQQAALKHTVAMLKIFGAGKEPPKGSSMEITYHIRAFDDVAWKTAQSTGALSLMPYKQAQKFAGIYATQDRLEKAEDQAGRDAILALGPFLDSSDGDKDPTSSEAKALEDKVQTLQGQLLLVDSEMQALNGQQQEYLKGKN